MNNLEFLCITDPCFVIVINFAVQSAHLCQVERCVLHSMQSSLCPAQRPQLYQLYLLQLQAAEKPKLSVSSFYKAKFSKYSERYPPGRRKPQPQPSHSPSSSDDPNTSLNGHQAPWSVPVYYGDTHNRPPPAPHHSHQPSLTPHQPTHFTPHSSSHPAAHHNQAPPSPPAPVRYVGPVYSHRRPSLFELLFKIYPTQLYLGWKRLLRS